MSFFVLPKVDLAKQIAAINEKISPIINNISKCPPFKNARFHKNGANEETLTLDLFLGKEAL